MEDGFGWVAANVDLGRNGYGEGKMKKSVVRKVVGKKGGDAGSRKKALTYLIQTLTFFSMRGTTGAARQRKRRERGG